MLVDIPSTSSHQIQGMATSNTLSGLHTIDPRKLENTRRPTGSNIGLRRQHSISRTLPSAVQRSTLDFDDESGLGRFAPRIEEPSIRHRRHPLRQTVPSRPSTLGGSQSSTTDSGRMMSEGGSSANDDDTTTTIPTSPGFEFLPVESTQQARAAFDFYANSYVTSIIEVSPQDVNSYSYRVQQILHDELLFTAFTTCSEAARWRTQCLYADPPLRIAKGYGKTIALLSQRLRAEKFAMTPAVLLTMEQLIAIETLTKNVSATARHLAGMQSAMTAKTGSKPIQRSAPVQTAVDVWTQFFIHRAIVMSKVNRHTVLTYPRHPFNPEISERISKLPFGFADVALSGRVSVEMLELLDQFNAYFTSINRLINEGIIDSPERTQIVLQQAAYCIEYAQMRALTLIERLLLVALTAYVVRKDRIHPGLVAIRNYYQITCAYVANLLNSEPLHQKDEGSNLMVWIGLVLLLTSTPEAYARKLALKILLRRPEPLKLMKQCQEFFWDEDLTSALLSGSALVTKTANDLIAETVRQVLSEGDDLEFDL